MNSLLIVRKIFMSIIPVILCGGSGSRLWPESRDSLPKPFIPLVGGKSCFQVMLETIKSSAIFDVPVILAHEDHEHLVRQHLHDLDMGARILLEPVRRNSGAVCAIAAAYVAGLPEAGPASIVGIFASDHLYADMSALIATFEIAIKLAKSGKIALMGIKPDHPATGYGYFLTSNCADGGPSCRVCDFVEKPDSEKAAELVGKGYLWNSGNLIGRADKILQRFARYMPELSAPALEIVRILKEREGGVPQHLKVNVLDKKLLGKMSDISMDKAILQIDAEKVSVDHELVGVELDAGWADIGLWSSMLTCSPVDAAGNSLMGDVVALETRRSLVRSSGALTIVAGLDDIVVVTTPDAVLVTSTARAALVKQAVGVLRLMQRDEVVVHLNNSHVWGSSRILGRGHRHLVREVTIKPGFAIDAQEHFHQSEHWTIVSGAAEVSLNGEVSVIHELGHVFIKENVVHSVRNPGKIDLVIMIVETGSCIDLSDDLAISPRSS